jgi:TP901 family phage tail tape measure protein
MAAANVLTVNVKLNADGSMLINGVKKSREEVDNFAKSSTTARDKVKEFGDSSAAMGNKVAELGKSEAAVKDKTKEVGDKSKEAGDKVAEFSEATMGLVASLAAAGGALYKVVDAGVEFETKLNQLIVITGIEPNAFSILKTRAMELSNEIGLTAAKFAETAAVMGSKRPELLKLPEVLAATTKEAIMLSEAANAMGIAMSEAEGATYLGGTLNQFSLDASQSARVINVFTAAAKEGAALIGDLASAMEKAGGSLSQANISVEESAGILETLAKFGIVGPEAGNAVRNFLTIIATASDKLEVLGISASEVNPQIVGFSGVLKRLEEAQLDAADAGYLFGRENVEAALRLIGNRTEVERLTKAVTGTQAAYEAAAKGDEPLQEQLEELTDRITNLTVGIYEHFEPALKSMMSTANTSVEIFTGLAVELGLINKSFSSVAEGSLEAQATVFAMNETFKALEPIAKIVGVGGILWVGFTTAPGLIAGTGAAVAGFGAITTGVTNAIGITYC